MADTIKKMWQEDGGVCDDIHKTNPYNGILYFVNKERELLLDTLTDSQKKIFFEYERYEQELKEYSEFESFKAGCKKGALLMAHALLP